MCTNINVNLPTVVSFLMLYSLRCGSIMILVWTLFRAIFCLIFFIIAMQEVFLTRVPPLGSVFPKKPAAPTSDEPYFFVFISYIAMIVTESFLTMFTIYLGMGLYYDTPGRVQQYLICRFCSWIVEIMFIIVLCIAHYYLIGWYLIFLMIVILEFYAFIVVYSYYVDMVEEKHKDKPGEADEPAAAFGHQHAHMSRSPSRAPYNHN